MQAAPAVPHCITLAGVTQLAPAQQPPAQLVLSHEAQTPETHSPPSGHAAQLAPPKPHAVVVVPGSHVAPLQQPAHELGSHTHVPPSQRCPAPQGGPLPQAQSPSESQVSARVASQPMQISPPVPHASRVGETQSAPEQQPVLHEVASHTHAPA